MSSHTMMFFFLALCQTSALRLSPDQQQDAVNLLSKNLQNIMGNGHGKMGLELPGLKKEDPDPCEGEFKKLNDTKFARKLGNCDASKGQHMQKALITLTNGESEEAANKAIVEYYNVFKGCGQFSEQCAQQAAEGIVLELRVSGEVVSKPCLRELKKQNKGNAQYQKDLARCQFEKLEGTDVDLVAGKVGSAAARAGKVLEECTKLSPKCAWQLEYAFLSQIVEQYQKDPRIIKHTVEIYKKPIAEEKFPRMLAPGFQFPHTKAK